MDVLRAADGRSTEHHTNETLKEIVTLPFETENLTDDERRLLSAAQAGAEGDYDAFREAVLNGHEHIMPPPPRVALRHIPEVADDFIRNFLVQHRMQQTLENFENEWYELFGSHAYRNAPVVPDNYLETAALQQQIEVLEKDLKSHAETTAKAVKLWQLACKERDFHRSNHNRVVQEKHQIVKQLKQAHTHAEDVTPVFEDMQKRCNALQKAKTLLTIERDRYRDQVNELEKTVAELGRSLEEKDGATDSGKAGAASQRSDTDGSKKGRSVNERTKGGKAANAVASSKKAPNAAGGYAWPSDERTRVPQAPQKPQKSAGTGSSSAATAKSRASKSGSTTPGLESRKTRPEDQIHGNLAASDHIPSASPEPVFPDGDLEGSRNSAGDAKINANPSGWACTASFDVYAAAAASVALHPTKSAVASASDDGTWCLQALPTGDVILTGKGHEDYVASVAMHPGGAMAATGSGDKTIKLWDFATNRCRQTLRAHTDAVWALDFQETGQLLASASLDETARVFDVETGKCLQALRGHVHAVNDVAWRPYTNSLYTGSGDKTVSLWDARANCCVQTFFGHRTNVLSVSPNVRDDSMLVSSSADGVVIVWDVRTLQQRLAVVCGPRAVNEVVFESAEGRYVAAASDDGTIKIVDTLEESVSLLQGHTDAVQSVAFDPVGSKYLVSCGNDGTVRYWN